MVGDVRKKDMPRSATRFQAGDQVQYPQIIFSAQKGCHEVVCQQWKIKAIFPLSEIAVLTKLHQSARFKMQVPLALLANYN